MGPHQSKAFGLLQTKPEKVFLRTNPKPIETSTTFPHQLMNGQNSWSTHLADDH